MLVHNLLENAAANFPEKNAVWYNDEWKTNYEVNSAANKVAAFLLDCGIRRGDRVAILQENSFNYIAIYFGILKAGAVTVGLNTETNKDALVYLLNDSESKAIFVSRKSIKNLLPAFSEIKTIENVIINQESMEQYTKHTKIQLTTLSEIFSGSELEKSVRSIDIDLAEIVYTSGSTGKPKGVMLTHLNLVNNMISISSYLKLTETDRIMTILPFYYIYGKSLLLTHFLVGGSLVIDNSFVYPNKVLETMKKTDATGFAGVPSTFSILLNRSNLKEMDFPSLRYVTQAGGAMAPAVQKEVVKAFSPAEVYIMYGATEAAPRLSWLDPKQLFSKWGSIGIPVDNVDLLIVNDNGTELPRGEIGEIAARGSNIMKGYWKAPEETAKVLKHGMYFTGDLGKQDEEGYFYVVGRSKDIIKVKGFRVGAKEIEEIIQEIDNVHETAVIGVDDPVLGEAIMALITPKEKGWNNEQEIMEHLRNRLPPLKHPKYIKFRESFPKNESGKILKVILKEEENSLIKEH